jgi:LysM repeat protein
MAESGGRSALARFGAPAAFLAAATVAVLLVRAGLHTTAAPAPSATRTQPAVVVSNHPATRTTGPAKRFYMIRAGDTLAEIADRLGVSVERLVALNPGVRPTSLRIGQRIRTR